VFGYHGGTEALEYPSETTLQQTPRAIGPLVETHVEHRENGRPSARYVMRETKERCRTLSVCLFLIDDGTEKHRSGNNCDMQFQ
jgi:hypothetical protein